MRGYPRARRSDIVVQTSGDDTLIYDLETNKAYSLNVTSAAVWNLSNGNRTTAQISDEMSKNMKTLIDQDIVLLALDQLSEDGLLEEGFSLDEKFNGQSRRELIKRLALASAIALPIVSSIMAPKAANAQSVCTTPALCDCPNGTGQNNTCGQGGVTFAPCFAGCLCRSDFILIGPSELGTCV